MNTAVHCLHSEHVIALACTSTADTVLDAFSVALVFENVHSNQRQGLLMLMHVLADGLLNMHITLQLYCLLLKQQIIG